MKVAVVLQQMQSYKEREMSSMKGISPFWILLHLLCCLVSTLLGFRFSRLLFFLFFSSSPLLSSFHPHSPTTITTTTTTTTITTITTTFSSSSSLTPSNSTSNAPIHQPNSNANASTTAFVAAAAAAFSQPVTTRPVVGRHGIRVRPWPHPDPVEVMKAHQIIRQVQLEQRKMFSITKTPRPLIVVTPTYARAAQALHLTALAQTLRNVPYRVTWLVIEASGVTNATASVLAKSRVPFVHAGFDEPMPDVWESRRVVEAKMRVRALRLISDQQMEGIIIFADESNVHDLKLFDEAQKVKSIGAIRLSFLTDPRILDQENNQQGEPVAQGPICNSEGQVSSWLMLDPANDAFSPQKMEWAGFVLDSKWLLEKELDDIDESLKGLLGDNGSGIEPLSNCGEKVLVWWIRAEAQPDTKFPPQWAVENGIPSESATNSTARRDENQHENQLEY